MKKTIRFDGYQGKAVEVSCESENWRSPGSYEITTIEEEGLVPEEERRKSLVVDASDALSIHAALGFVLGVSRA